MLCSKIGKAKNRFLPPWLGLGLVAALGLSGSAGAQHARRVADLNTAPGSSTFGGFSVATVGDRIYFTFADEANGTELWSTDGTAQDTRLVIDLHPGPDIPSPAGPSCVGCGGPLNPYPTDLVPFHDALFFRAGDGTLDATLWRTDGSAAATTSLDHDASGNAIRNPSGLTVAGAFLFFFANYQYPRSVELFRTDGTIAGTNRLHHFDFPDAATTSSSFPGAMSPLGNTLLFAGYDAQHGAELWKSNGTPEGTGLVADLNPGAVSSRPDNIVVLDDRAFFFAEDGTHGRALWMTDGETVTLVSSFPGNPPFASIRGSGVFQGRLYFTYCPSGATCDLWKSDGTPGGTQLLLADHDASALSPAGSGVVFAAGDTDHGRELWVTDGTALGTRLLRDLRSGPDSSSPEQLFGVGGLVYFSAYDGTQYHVWRTDGTEAGTVPLGPPDAGSVTAAVGFRNRAVLLTRQDYGQEQVWISDGSRTGTAPLTPALPDASSKPDKLAALGNVALFSANATSGAGLFRSDGSESGTILVQGLAPMSAGPIPGSIVTLNEKAVFVGATWNGSQVFVSDGTPAGTFPLGIAGGYPGFDVFASVGSVFFQSGCCGLGKTDGTVTGTMEVKELPLDPNINEFFSMTSWRGGIAFIPDSDFEPPMPRLWVSDGTSGGTSMVSDVWADHLGNEPHLAALGDFLLFASRGNSGAELWRSDGTSAGTMRVVLVPSSPGMAYAHLDSFVRSGPFIFFRLVESDSSGDISEWLWRTDGTQQGTIPLAEFPYSRGFFDDVSWLTDVVGTLFFSAPDPSHGAELWKSDGTPQGTALVADIRPGPSPSAPQNLTAIGRLLVFTASDGEHGLEPWVSDGTAAGTRILQDLDPGPSSSGPSGFVAAGNRLFFAANDREAGRELWSMPLACLTEISCRGTVTQGPVGGVPVRRR